MLGVIDRSTDDDRPRLKGRKGSDVSFGTRTQTRFNTAKILP
jgi:hypothetical protein